MTVALAIATPAAGLIGVLLGVFLEPLKLRFVTTSRRRDQRAERCAEMVGSAREMISSLQEFRSVLNMAIERQGVERSRKRLRELMNDARRARANVERVSALIELGGPDDLAAAAWAARSAGSAVLLDAERSAEAFDHKLTVFEGRLDTFMDAAKRHVR